MNYIKDGIVKLPPGFRFQPTDEEIVFQYLTRKIFSLPLPASVVPEVNISQCNPWDLPGEWEEDRYFFNKKEAKCNNGISRRNNANGSGFWKATDSGKKIISSKKEHDIIGMKTTFIFYNGKARTNWIMHEYRLMQSQYNHSYDQNSFIEIGSWVLCHIFLKISGENIDEANLMTINYPLTSCSSSSTSVVTDEVNGLDDDDGDEETSGHQMYYGASYMK